MKMLLITLVFLLIPNIVRCMVAESARFRILAPQLICPKDENSPIQKPDYTVITIQVDADADFRMDWTVRWQPLHDPTQRFTVMIWSTVRALEAKLNGPQIEPFVYIISNNELLHGVNYIFNVSAISLNGEKGIPKSFYINNTFGDQTLEAVDGRTETLSVILVGGQDTYSDIMYVLEAEVTTCAPMYNYHFVWKVYNTNLIETLNISTPGCRLEIPPYQMQPGLIYNITCYIIKDDTEKIITQIELPLEVRHRGLEVYLSVDRLIVAIDHSFTLESTVINHDYLSLPLTYEWACVVNGRSCDFLERANESNLILSSGLPAKGQYEITVIVGVLHQSAKATAVIIARDSILPVIQLQPLPRLVNQNTKLSLIANVSNIMATCTLIWYFANEEQLNAINYSNDEHQHGTQITDSLIIFSLEENFLFELADYTNDTESRQVFAETMASAGRVRLVAECNSSVAFDCRVEEYAYAEIHFKLNIGPEPGYVSISPSSGTALQTIFRISTRPAVDSDGPLSYTFYCGIGNNITLILGSYLNHLTVETFLPYVDGGTEVWVTICDILGACSNSETKIIYLLKGEGRSINVVMAGIRAHIKRCEIILLQRSAVTAIATYRNAGQTERLVVFTAFLLDSVPTLSPRCVSQNNNQYLEFLTMLTFLGVDTSIFV